MAREKDRRAIRSSHRAQYCSVKVSSWPTGSPGARLKAEECHSESEWPGSDASASAWTPGRVHRCRRWRPSAEHMLHKVLLKRLLSRMPSLPTQCLLIFTFVIWGVCGEHCDYFLPNCHITPWFWAWEKLTPIWTKAIRGRSSLVPQWLVHRWFNQNEV